MPTLDNILNTAASGMSAESIQLNVIASNLANSHSVGTTEESTYRAKHAIFNEVTNPIAGLPQSEQPVGGVRVTDVKPSARSLDKRYEPDNPLANTDGFVYVTDVNAIEEMTNMIEASRSYQANVEIMNSTKNLIAQTIAAMSSK